ncbi:hypothetical protein ACLBTZ_26235, partial [Pseudomonas aeruginosa]|uniref:hypothetical protein n=1 Tax=Pseudomonas aeruginosa TaxID=287 RepID=UPI003969A8DD
PGVIGFGLSLTGQGDLLIPCAGKANATLCETPPSLLPGSPPHRAIAPYACAFRRRVTRLPGRKSLQAQPGKDAVAQAVSEGAS